MHFVKKVPTTDEEKRVKEKERAVKLKVFCELRDRIFAKRANDELDEEMLSLTGKLLSKNPDIYTFWNIRRSVLDLIRSTSEKDPNNETAKLEKLYVAELGLTEACLQANPKSYSAWFQRGWILQRQKNPDLDGELHKIKKALDADDRNFHCWDHRRVVSKLANLSSADELKFTNDRISANFSNYSAWHMRINLLEKVVDPMGELVLSDETLGDTNGGEIKKVANAFFTDFEDQSAWFYATWILNLYSPDRILHPDSVCENVPLSISFSGDHLWLSMCRPCRVEDALQFVKCETDEWRPFSRDGRHVEYSRVWSCRPQGNVTGVVSLEGSPSWSTVSPDRPLVNAPLLRRVIGLGRSCKATQLFSHYCRELLSVEPKSQWAHQILILALSIESPLENDQDIRKHYEHLRQLDPIRENMYLHMESEHSLRVALLSPMEGDESGGSLLESVLAGERRLPLRYKQLRSLRLLDTLTGLVDRMDLRGNHIQDVDELFLPTLAELTLDENPIERLPPSMGERFPLLEFLSIASTRVSLPPDVIPALLLLPSVSRFLFAQTPLVDHASDLQDPLSGIRLIPYYM